MFSILAQVLLLLAAQLDPSLMPRQSVKPNLPKIDENACPFEGCQFGKWTAREVVQLYSTWKPDRKPLGSIEKGQTGTALKGVYITFEPSESQVTVRMPAYGLEPGDSIFIYMNLGEGVFNAWFNGYWVEQFDASGIEGLGCSRDCTAKLVKPGRAEWWIEIRKKDGSSGWTKEGEKFDGSDALAAGGSSEP